MASPLVARLGWTLIHFIWEGALLAGLLAIALWLTTGRSPRLRYGLACLALTMMAASPVATWQWLGHVAPRVGAPPIRARAEGSGAHQPTGQISAVTEVPPRPGNPVAWLPICVASWMAGVALLSLRLAGRWAWLQWLRRRPETVPVEDDIQLRLLRLCQRMRLASNIRMLLCKRVSGPTVMGWLRPVILVPPAALLGMPPDQMELVLAHELAHILRHDFAINLIQSCVEVLLFYHPAVWWVSAKIRQERELCCDDLAVRTTGDALDYAAALTRLEALCRPPDPPRHVAQALAVGAIGGSFMHRIRRLVSPMAPIPLAPRAGLVVALLIGFSFMLHAARPHEAVSTSGNELVLRRFNDSSPDGVVKAGQVAFDGVRVPAEFGLQALDRLSSIPASGPMTELRLPIPTEPKPEIRPYSYNFPAVDSSQLRLILENHAQEKPLTLQSCPLHGVIIRRLNAATPQFSPLPGKSRLSVVAKEAGLDLVDAALRELADLKPAPFLFQRVEKSGRAPSMGDRALTIELSDVNPDELRMVLDAERTKPTPFAGTGQVAGTELSPHFVSGQRPPEGTMWLRRYDRDSADDLRRAGTIYVHVNTVPYSNLMKALEQLEQAPADPARGYVDLELKADREAKDPHGLWTYLFLGADPVRVKRVVQARATFRSLHPEDKRPGTIVIQRMARFTAQLGVIPEGLNVQVWAGNVPAPAVLQALQQLLAMQPEAGIPQEVRVQVPPDEPGARITLDLKDKNPSALWDELNKVIKAEKP